MVIFRNKYIIFFLLFFSNLFSCECEHQYDEEIIREVDQELDIYNDDTLYEVVHIPSQYNPQPDPEKTLKKAAYAFDSFRYNKCLEYIKQYERVLVLPMQIIPNDKKLTILAYKAYCKKFLKRYDSAIEFFEEMIVLLNKSDILSPECKFITYLEHAHCYLLSGNREEYQKRIKKIIELRIAPTYDYYASKGFKIHHQPCMHDHQLKKAECIIFHEVTPKLLGEELYTSMVKSKQTPKIYTVAQLDDQEECRRLCARASYISAFIIGTITKSSLAGAATIALGELLLDCETCCNEGWGSKNCLREIKTIFWNTCQQHILDDL
jgi:tetratricopeptide (TPR) repeat protein